MKDSVLVEVFNSSKDASSKKSSLLFRKLMLLAYVVSQISSRHQIHDEVQVFPILECLPHVDYKWILDLSEKLSLVGDRFHTLFSHDPRILFKFYTALDISFMAKKCPVLRS